MNYTLTAVLKVLSSLLANFAAGFLLTIPAIRNLWVLTGNFLFAIVCILLAIKIETILEELEL